MGLKASKFIGGSSNYIKVEDVKEGPLKLTIEDVESVEFDGKAKLQLIVTGGKKLTLNSTNTQTLIAAYSDDCDNWKGRGIVAYEDANVFYGGKRMSGLRLKVPAAKTKAEAAPAKPAADDADDLGF